MRWMVCVALLATQVALPVYAHGSIDQRLADATEKLGIDGVGALPWVRRAALYRERGELEAALADLDQADARRSGDARARTLRAEVLIELGRSSEGEAVLDQVLAAHPCHVPALEALGRLRVHRAHFLEAAESFADATSCGGGPRPARVLEHANALAAAGGRQRAAAVADLERALETLGPVPALLDRLIELELELGRSASALARMNAALERTPASPWWLARRGDLLRSLAREDEARHDYLRASQTLREHARPGAAYRELAARLDESLAAIELAQ